jgi:hypothetical protein
MDQTYFPVILTPFNYYEWKPKIELLLRSNSLYRVTMGTEFEPNSAIEKSKYFNRMDESYEMFCLSIYLYLLFHVDTCKTPNDVWINLKDFLGNKDKLSVDRLENDLHALNPSDFENLQEYLYKHKKFLLHVRACGIDKKDEQLIFSILTKLGPEYFVYPSSFHTIRLTMGSTWKIPFLYEFMDSLIHEKTKLIFLIHKKDEQLIFSILTKLGPEYFVYPSSFHTIRLTMGSTWKMSFLYEFMDSLIHEKTKLIQIWELKSSNPHVLTTQVSSKKNKMKNKGKKDQENKKEGEKNSTYEILSSKASKSEKDNTRCSYYNKGFHHENFFMKKDHRDHGTIT